MRKYLMILSLAVIGGGMVYLTAFRRHDRKEEPKVPEHRSSAGGRPARPANNGLTEVPSGDPRIRNFIGPDGKRAKVIRLDEKQRPVIEIDYKDDQKSKIERIFADDGKLLKERHSRNEALIREETFK